MRKKENFEVIQLSGKLGFEELKKTVLENDICTSCGACVLVCPFKGVLKYSDGKPKLIGECKICGICPRVCPRYNPQISELENFFLGRTRLPEEVFGAYREVHVGKSTDFDVLKRCQDGGVVTALINAALNSGLIDGAVISGVDPSSPWLPLPSITTTSSDTIRYSGTRYTYSPNLLALERCVAEGRLKKVLFVGTPCQILALRRIQKVPLKKISNIVAFTVGLFCSESFTYTGLMEKKIRDELNIDLNKLEKINIKGKMLLTLTDGQVIEIPLKDAKNYAEKKCKFCTDFSSEFADLSVGGVGLDHRTFIVVRTEKGKKLFDNALGHKTIEIKPATEFAKAYDLLTRLSKLKLRNIQNRVK